MCEGQHLRQRTCLTRTHLPETLGHQRHVEMAGDRVTGLVFAGVSLSVHRTPAGDHDVDLIQTRRWLAQGACGQQPAVAHPAFVLHHDFHVARHLDMLQAIVGNDEIHLGVTGQQRLDRQLASRVHRDRAFRFVGDQGRLVTKQSRVGEALRHPWRGSDFDTITTAHHTRYPAFLTKRLGACDHHRRLACPANVYVADHDNRYGSLPGMSLGTRALSMADDPSGQAGKRVQQVRHQAPLLPPALSDGGESSVKRALQSAPSVWLCSLRGMMGGMVSWY